MPGADVKPKTFGLFPAGGGFVTPPDSSPSENRQLARAAGTVGFFTFLSRILGLVRDMVVARFFGAGMAADAFFVAFRIPNLLRRLFAEGSLSIAFVPVFTEYLQQKRREDAVELARVALTMLSLLLAVVTILGVLGAPWIVRIQAWGFGAAGDRYELTVLLTRITFPYIFLISLVALFMGILNALRHFAAPAAAPIFLNVAIIGAVYWLYPRLSEPVVGLALGVIIGGVLQVMLQVPWLLKNGISLRPRWLPGHPAVARIGRLMLPAVFGSAVYQFNQFVGTLLASFLPQGSVSWLYYADRVVQFPLGVFAIAVSTAALPSLSRQAAEEGLHAFRGTLGYALRLVFFISLPSMAGLMILAPLIVRVLFERGVFQAASTDMTAQALVFYSAGLWAFSGIRVLVAGFYGLQDTKTPVKAAFIALLINAGCSLALMGPLRHGGLALALSIASTAQLLFLGVLLRSRIHGLEVRRLLRSVVISLCASGAMSALLFWVYRVWWRPGAGTGLGELIIGLGGLVALGALVYFALCFFLGSEELASMLRLVRVKR
ncbi:MAG: murein biosynthesis integral membrane protein MurJ [Deltaproteobacteria bacterium]|nr:murein biosynthesis integral membrane protein MurJ [Deltaproteobacteria bacterium]